MGAPGLAFETWESTIPTSRCDLKTQMAPTARCAACTRGKERPNLPAVLAPQWRCDTRTQPQDIAPAGILQASLSASSRYQCSPPAIPGRTGGGSNDKVPVL